MAQYIHLCNSVFPNNTLFCVFYNWDLLPTIHCDIEIYLSNCYIISNLGQVHSCDHTNFNNISHTQ